MEFFPFNIFFRCHRSTLLSLRIPMLQLLLKLILTKSIIHDTGLNPWTHFQERNSEQQAQVASNSTRNAKPTTKNKLASHFRVTFLNCKFCHYANFFVLQKSITVIQNITSAWLQYHFYIWGKNPNETKGEHVFP